ncbi:MAG: D-glycero-beta-D-manno-heptose 1-phosphate adenylyltransferase [Proteobacteria bacterium]|nr:D-glycero-beta-D-manno-heptose 1-phosphate adenylyltransferase [Pseudomonadota bacterium]
MFRLSKQKIIEKKKLADIREELKRQDKVVVLTNGCFDLMHAGHLSSLEHARQLGDVLFVGLNSDASIRRYKGADRPVISQSERAQMVAALECVDYVVLFDESAPVELVRALQPDIYCKGAEYTESDDMSMPEAAVVRSYGGQVVLIPMKNGLSTTEIINRIRDGK